MQCDDAALADEAEAALLADAVDRGVIDVVFQGPAPGQDGRPCYGAGRPVRRQHDEVGAKQRQDAGRLGKAAVVADVDADAKAAEVVDGERPVARRGEAIDSQERQMDFAVAGNEACRPDQGRRR